MGPSDLEQLCPDWQERDAYLSGPTEMLDAFRGNQLPEDDRAFLLARLLR